MDCFAAPSCNQMDELDGSTTSTSAGSCRKILHKKCCCMICTRGHPSHPPQHSFPLSTGFSTLYAEMQSASFNTFAQERNQHCTLFFTFLYWPHPFFLQTLTLLKIKRAHRFKMEHFPQLLSRCQFVTLRTLPVNCCQ